MLPKPIIDQLSKKKQSIYILLPFFLLVICFGAINLFPVNSASPKPISITSTPVNIPEQIVQVQPTEFIEATPTSSTTPLPTPTLLPSPTPNFISQIPLGIDISLLGPPTGSIFPLSSQISFYWTWPIPLEDNQTFAIYLYANDQEYNVGTRDKPDLGTVYHFSATVKDIFQDANIVYWQIQLIAPQSATILIESEIRTINLFAGFRPNSN